jgi:hypothetical protein
VIPSPGKRSLGSSRFRGSRLRGSEALHIAIQTPARQNTFTWPISDGLLLNVRVLKGTLRILDSAGTLEAIHSSPGVVPVAKVTKTRNDVAVRG